MGYFGNPYQPQPMGYNPYGGYPPKPAERRRSNARLCGSNTRVNGRNGAEAFRLAPNSSILLMDENDPIVWLKQTDGAGYATVTPYTVAPYKRPPVDVNSLENRVKRLEEILNAKSDDADATEKQQKTK